MVKAAVVIEGQKKGPLSRPPQVHSVAWVSACSFLN
jgi:hypothetical protein